MITYSIPDARARAAGRLAGAPHITGPAYSRAILGFARSHGDPFGAAARGTRADRARRGTSAPRSEPDSASGGYEGVPCIGDSRGLRPGAARVWRELRPGVRG